MEMYFFVLGAVLLFSSIVSLILGKDTFAFICSILSLITFYIEHKIEGWKIKAGNSKIINSDSDEKDGKAENIPVVLPDDTDEMLTFFQESILKIDETRKSITSSTKMAESLGNLQITLVQIFDWLKDHSESGSSFRKAYSYYLPEIMNIIDTYVSLDSILNPTDNVLSIKKSIEEAIDPITVSFRNLYNNMFEDTGLTVKTDIDTLQAVMKSDGLSGSDFADVDTAVSSFVDNGVLKKDESDDKEMPDRAKSQASFVAGFRILTLKTSWRVLNVKAMEKWRTPHLLPIYISSMPPL